MDISLANLWVCYLFFLLVITVGFSYVFSRYPQRSTSVVLLIAATLASALTLSLSCLLPFETLDMASSLWFFLLLALCLAAPVVLLLYSLWRGDLWTFASCNWDACRPTSP